jgi:hypothetical protein
LSGGMITFTTFGYSAAQSAALTRFRFAALPCRAP